MTLLRILVVLSICFTPIQSNAFAAQPEMLKIPLATKITRVQPMTGLVLWSDNEANATDAIQLEYSYMRYDDVIKGPGQYDWSGVDRLLDHIAARQHQAIIRFYFDYPGKISSVPGYVKSLADYRETKGLSEGEATTFCDWSNATLRQATLDFYTELAKRYDRDARLAFLQTGFGLWSEYHIYDGPMELGRTFPSLEFQAEFANHLAATFAETPWSVSVDAADDERSPLAERDNLRALPFGLFDDSFLCKQHAKQNANDWAAFGNDRWQTSPAGGELSYYTKRDQRHALAVNGPYGIAFESLAAKFHVTYMIGDGQPNHQSTQRIAAAGMSLGYRFAVTSFLSADGRSEVTIKNNGIAPIYHNAYATVDGVRSEASLRGLLPGESKMFIVAAGSATPSLTIASDRLVPGQVIEFEADGT